jgi:hypothetical protein
MGMAVDSGSQGYPRSTWVTQKTQGPPKRALFETFYRAGARLASATAGFLDVLGGFVYRFACGINGITSSFHRVTSRRVGSLCGFTCGVGGSCGGVSRRARRVCCGSGRIGSLTSSVGSSAGVGCCRFGLGSRLWRWAGASSQSECEGDGQQALVD